MPSFCCKFCGMITDNPEMSSDYSLIDGDKHRYHYSITCPVCEKETRFWRDKPFPTDKK